MPKNYFIQTKDPCNWRVQNAFHRLEEANPQATHRVLLKELKKNLKQARDSGTRAQSEEAERLLGSWKTIKDKLTRAEEKEDVAAEQQDAAPTAAPSDSGQSIIVYGDYNVAGRDLNVTHNHAAAPQTSADDTNHDTNSSDSDAKSWDSNNPHPQRRTICIYDSSSYSLKNDIGPADCDIQGIDLGEDCRLYRKESIRGAQERESLSDGRILSLSYIFLLSDTQRCVLSTLRNKAAVIKAFDKNARLKRVGNDLLLDCKSMVDMIDDGSTQEAIARQLHTSFDQAEYASDEVRLAGLVMLRNLVERLNHWRFPNELKEGGFIKQALLNIVEATVCKVQRTKSDWGTYSMVPHPKSEGKEIFLPDFTLYNAEISSEVRFEMITMEVKATKPSRNKYESDLVRLGKQLQIIIDKQVLYGVPNPVAMGVLVRGLEIKFFRMTLDGNGLYFHVELATLYLMRSPSDAPLIPAILERFLQLKAIVQESVDNLYSAAEHRRHEDNIDAVKSRKKSIKRACSTPILCSKSESRKKRKRRT
ncbi:hypothetical protein DFQ28_002264 [Apophysomyces sp. BC1034]|nr:hypothetical protein DFQ28_002264 [Apophysomyces sp. BC1034]